MYRTLAAKLRTETSRLLGHEAVFKKVQQALLVSLDARRKMDRNLLRFMAAMNIPAHYDIARVNEQIELLETEIQTIQDRLDRVQDLLEKKKHASS